MLFCIICTDKPNAGALRAETRAAHLQYLERFKDRIAIAGPLLTDDRAHPKGSLLILDFAGAEEAAPQPRQPLAVAARPAIFDHEVLPLDIAELAQGLKEGAGRYTRVRAGGQPADAPNPVALLRARDKLGPEEDGYYAQMVRANTQPHKDWLQASNRRHQMRLAWAEFFKDWDVLLCPNAATAAFPHSMPGERWERMISVNGKPQPATTQMWWAGISGMCNLPATAARASPGGGGAAGCPGRRARPGSRRRRAACRRI